MRDLLLHQHVTYWFLATGPDLSHAPTRQNSRRQELPLLCSLGPPQFSHPWLTKRQGTLVEGRGAALQGRAEQALQQPPHLARPAREAVSRESMMLHAGR